MAPGMAYSRTFFIVETVDGSGRAQVMYALGDSAEANVTREYRRLPARIVGDLLTFDLSDGASVVYHMDVNSLRGTYASSRRRYKVTLTRAALAEVMAVPASVPDHPLQGRRTTVASRRVVGPSR